MVTIEFFNEISGTLVDSATVSRATGDQETVSTVGTFYAETIMTTPACQGSARVLVKGARRVICSAYVLSTASPPTFVIELPRFNKSGKP